jgi:hypothetical protein
MHRENEPVNLAVDQQEKLKVLAAEEHGRSYKDKRPINDLLQAAGLSAEQIELITSYAAAEGKAGREFDQLSLDQVLSMIQRKNRIVATLPSYTAHQIAGLNKSLSRMRHDINGKLAIMLAAAELAKMKPEMAAKMTDRIIEQPEEMKRIMREFSDEFERTLGIAGR